MEFFLDLSTWAGLITLVILEVVLGIDNLVFVAILAEKLPSHERDKARLIGLSLALLMRFALLSLISWLVTLTHPIFINKYFILSGRDLILLFGGLFLLFKATVELHERLENKNNDNSEENKQHPGFWAVVIQIIILDAIFSLDAIITSVGMVNSLFIMMTAVVIAMTLMLLASKPLTNFMNIHHTVVVLCLSFLLMIGFSLVAEALQFHIPKAYLYVAIGFSMLIELFNQISRRNFIRYQSHRPLRQRAAEAILRLIVKEQNNNKFKNSSNKKNNKPDLITSKIPEGFKDEEKYMINGVLTLAGRSIRSIMTPRREISWVNINHSKTNIRSQLLDTPHSLFPVCKGELDEIIGVVRAKELLVALEKNIDINNFSANNPPIIIPDTLDPINLLGVLRRAKGSLVIVSNEFGVVQGLITPLDVLEAIAGEFPDADETPDIIKEKGDNWLVKGSTDLHALEQSLNTKNFVKEGENYTSLGGFLIAQKGQLPLSGEKIYINHFEFHIIEATEYRIDLVRISKNKNNYL